jgi:hypothetical protein
VAERSDTIRQVGEKWALFSKKTGKKISEHATEEQAKAQETAINMAKARAAGHHLPAPPKKTDADPADVPCCVELLSTGLWAVISADGEKVSEHASEAEAMQAVSELHRPASAKMDARERVHRIDTVEGADLAPPKRLENGFLLVDARLSRTGVFTYRNKDGTKRRELRLPDEVFSQKAMDSFRLLPATDEHPPAFLTSDNARDFARGSLGEARRDATDQRWLRGPIMVTDAGLVEKMERGDARQVSLGYTCELEWKSGEYEGEKYDCIQRDILGNHVAVVESARAGPGARVRMDSADDTVITVDSPTRGPMAKIKIGDVEYEQGSESHLQALAAQQKRADADREAAEQRAKAAEEKAAKAQADADKAKARADAADEEAKKASELAKAAPAKAAEQIRARMKLEDDARAVLGRDAKLDGLNDREVQEKVLKQTTPELKLDGKSADYVQARFEIAVEQAREDAAEDDPDREDGQGSAAARARAGEGGNLDADDPPPRTNNGRGRHVRGDATAEDYKEHTDKDEAYDAMVRRSRSAWKQPLSDNKPAF